MSATSSAGRMDRLFGRDYLQGELIKRARRPGDQPGRDLGVAGRRLQVAVTEQNLDDPNVRAALQKMSGKTMPQRVGRHMLADPGRDKPTEEHRC